MIAKNLFKAFLVLAALVALYLSGPHIPMDETIIPTELPSNLDDYLYKKEAAFLDIKPNNEKKIIYAKNNHQRTEYVIVYFHGFTGSRQEISPVPQILARRLRANLFCTRFTGHGRFTIDATQNVTANDWLNDAVEALEIGKKLGRKIIILSSSTGSTISTWLTHYAPESIHALIMLSPNFMPKDKNMIWVTRPWGKLFTKMIYGREIRWGGEQSKVNPAWTTHYRTELFYPMMATVHNVQHYNYQNFKAPLLIFYSKDDMIVDPEYTKRVFSRWGSDNKRMIEILNVGDNDKHILAGDIKSPENNEFVLSRSLQFISLLPYTAWR